MDWLKSTQAGGVAGIVAVVALLVVSFMVPAPPGVDEPASEYLAYLVDNRSMLMAQSSLSLLPTFPLLLFVPSFRRFLGASEDKNQVLAEGASLGIVAGWAIGILVSFQSGALAFLSESTLDEAQARNLMISLTVGYTAAVVLWGAAALLAGLALIGEKGAARWAGWFGVAVAILTAASLLGWDDDGVFAVGQLMFVAYLANFAFLLFGSVLLVRRK